MEQFSISFAVGKGSAPHGGNIEHNNRAFLAKNVNDVRSPLNIVFARTDIEDAYHQLFDAALLQAVTLCLQIMDNKEYLNGKDYASFIVHFNLSFFREKAYKNQIINTYRIRYDTPSHIGFTLFQIIDLRNQRNMW